MTTVKPPASLEEIQQFTVRIASTMSRAMFRRTMTYVYSKARHGMVEVAEVECPLISPDPFEVFDDPDVIELLKEWEGR